MNRIEASFRYVRLAISSIIKNFGGFIDCNVSFFTVNSYRHKKTVISKINFLNECTRIYKGQPRSHYLVNDRIEEGAKICEKAKEGTLWDKVE